MPADEKDTPDRALLRAELRAVLERKLDELPESFRTVFVLRSVEELSVEETAQTLNLPEATVRELIAVADERYAEVLDDWEFAEAVRAGFDPAERQEVLSMLWEVAYADGNLVVLEDRLLNRLAEQLELDAEAADAARATAVARAGLLIDGATGN